MSELVPSVSTDTDSMSLDYIEMEKKLGGKTYLLREASEAAAVTYRNACARAAKMVDGKVVGVEGIGEVEPLLVSSCLFEVIDPEGRRLLQPVDLRTVKGWPSRIVKPIFEWVKEHSELDETETEEQLLKRIANDTKKLEKLRASKVNGVHVSPPKNEPSSGTDTSA